MRAVIQDTYGTSEVLRIGDVDIPEPGEHEVLVKVHAAVRPPVRPPVRTSVRPPS